MLADGARTRTEVRMVLEISQLTIGRILADLVNKGCVTKV